MIPDPATTPLKPARQALFGFSVAMVYAISTDPSPGLRALLRSANVCAIRGLSLHAWDLWSKFQGVHVVGSETEIRPRPHSFGRSPGTPENGLWEQFEFSQISFLNSRAREPLFLDFTNTCFWDAKNSIDLMLQM